MAEYGASLLTLPTELKHIIIEMVFFDESGKFNPSILHICGDLRRTTMALLQDHYVWIEYIVYGCVSRTQGPIAMIDELALPQDRWILHHNVVAADPVLTVKICGCSPLHEQHVPAPYDSRVMPFDSKLFRQIWDRLSERQLHLRAEVARMPRGKEWALLKVLPLINRYDTSVDLKSSSRRDLHQGFSLKLTHRNNALG